MILNWFICRSFILPAVLLLGLAFPAVVAADEDLCFGGVTYGSWELPPGIGGTGSASGVLVAEGSDQPLYYLDATLNEYRSPMDFRVGDIKGLLHDPNDPFLAPHYAFEGSWRTAFRDFDHGTWQAKISKPDTGAVVGEISGSFAIPATGDGEFYGEWYICEEP